MTRAVVWLGNKTQYEVLEPGFTEQPCKVFELAAIEVKAIDGRRCWINGRRVDGVFVEQVNA